MRDRLIELIQESVNGCARNWAEVIADYLLANGVIVPPVQMCQEFYHIEEFKHNFLPDSYPTEKVVCTSKVERRCGVMKKCVYQKKGYYGQIKCGYTGTSRNVCPLKTCRQFRPTLRYRLFGKWHIEAR